MSFKYFDNRIIGFLSVCIFALKNNSGVYSVCILPKKFVAQKSLYTPELHVLRCDYKMAHVDSGRCEITFGRCFFRGLCVDGGIISALLSHVSRMNGL